MTKFALPLLLLVWFSGFVTFGAIGAFRCQARCGSAAVGYFGLDGCECRPR